MATKILPSAINTMVAVEPESRLFLDASYMGQLKDVNARAQRRGGGGYKKFHIINK